MKNKPVLPPLLLIGIFFMMISCSKNQLGNSTENLPEITHAFSEQKQAVFNNLELRSNIVRDSFLNTVGFSFEGDGVKKSDELRINDFINSYLIGERQILINSLANQFKGASNGPPKSVLFLNDTIQITKSGTITGTDNGIVCVFKMVGTKIEKLDYTITGLHGTIQKLGDLEQTVYNGVTTYQFNLIGTWTFYGVNLTAAVKIYGNIYLGEATVQGMVISG